MKPINLNEIQEQNKRNWTSLDLSSDEETCSSHRNPVLTGKDRLSNHQNPSLTGNDSEQNVHITKTLENLGKKVAEAAQHENVPKERECYWKLPDVEPECDTATKSFLASKLSDLTDLAEKLKAKLNQNATPKDISGQFKNSNSQVQNNQSFKSHLNNENSAFSAAQNVPAQSSFHFQSRIADSSTMTSAFFGVNSEVGFPETNFRRSDLNLERLLELSDEDEEGAKQNQVNFTST